MNTIVLIGKVTSVHLASYEFNLAVADSGADPHVDLFVVQTDGTARLPLEGEHIAVDGSVSSSGIVQARRVVVMGLEQEL